MFNSSFCLHLFAGSEQGAQWAAILYTLLGSAIRHGHNPFDYLKDVLQKLPDTKMNQLQKLFPDNWKPSVEKTQDLLHAQLQTKHTPPQ